MSLKTCGLSSELQQTLYHGIAGGLIERVTSPEGKVFTDIHPIVLRELERHGLRVTAPGITGIGERSLADHFILDNWEAHMFKARREGMAKC